MFYGPIEAAEDIFSAVALVDVAFNQIEKCVRHDREHPRYMIG
ncbi:MAG: hypothetical protein QGG23_05035 [Candidatus Bathyarchaeota archaeon]|nr:hypothetical protein [Candidatus Bathyarchaeota archaeon]MDP7443917.1 hypothetical protein [Candidatus Bathyarchaeota archaeon]